MMSVGAFLPACLPSQVTHQVYVTNHVSCIMQHTCYSRFNVVLTTTPLLLMHIMYFSILHLDLVLGSSEQVNIQMHHTITLLSFPFLVFSSLSSLTEPHSCNISFLRSLKFDYVKCLVGQFQYQVLLSVVAYFIRGEPFLY